MQVLKELELFPTMYDLLGNNFSFDISVSCTFVYGFVTPLFNKGLYVWQESQQRIVVIKKESERLAQEINQSDTNKLGNKV